MKTIWTNETLPAQCLSQLSPWTVGSPVPFEGPSYTLTGWTTPESQH